MKASNSAAQVKKTIKGRIDLIDQKKRQESERYLSQLLMIPYNTYWGAIVVAVAAVQSYFIGFLLICQEHSHNITTEFIYYVLELIYFVDTVLVIVHRCLPKYHKNSYVGKEPLILIIISVLSLLPYFELYILLATVDTYNLRFYFKIKVLIRFFKIIIFFINKRKTGGLNQLLVLVIYSLYINSSCTMVISFIWHQISCKDNCTSTSTIADHQLGDYRINNDSPFDIFTLSYTIMGNMLTHNWNGVFRGKDFVTKLIEILVMACGYVLHLMIFIGQLTSEYINKHKKQSTFNNRLTLIQDYLDRHKVPKELENDIIEYYNVLWDKRSGFHKMPDTFYLLPLSLQKEVTVDIFWDALRHSHIFGKVDMAFKREISLVMRSEFLNPNELLYKAKDSVNKMVYIISGIIQILSDEDEKSPIASFSPGTILGEMGLIMPLQCIAYVKCATYCEIHTLSASDLYRKLTIYRGRRKGLQNELQSRLEMARLYKQRMTEQKVVYNIYGVEEQIDRPIRRLKKQWRALWEMQKNDDKKGNVSRLKASDLYINDHTARHLDLLVLCDEMDLKVEVVCLTGTFPFILHPDSSFLKFCYHLSLFAIIIESIIIPYSAAFQRNMTISWKTTCLILDFIYLFDLCIQLTTAIKRKDSVVSNFGAILMSRLRQFSFQIDLLASLPVDYILLTIGAEQHFIILLKIPRIFKLYKLLVTIYGKENLLGTSPFIIRVIKYFVRYMLAIYFFICVMYMSTCFYTKCLESSWYSYNVLLIKKNNGTSNLKELHPFARSLYYVTSLLLGLGMHEEYPYTYISLLKVHGVVLVGYYLLSLCYSELTATEYWLHHTEKQLFDKSNIMRKFAKLKKLPSSVQRSISEYMLFRWDYNHNTAFEFGPKGIFVDLPDRIRSRLMHHQIEVVLLKTELFASCRPELIKELANIAKTENYPVGAFIAKANYFPTHLHIIRKGFVSIESFVPGDKERGRFTLINGPGKCLPTECLHSIDSFVTIISITCVEAITIPFLEITKIFSAYPVENNILQMTLKSHMKQHWSILTRQPTRLNNLLNTSRKSNIGYGDHFKYVLPNFNFDPAPLKVKEDSSIFRLCLLRTTISPYGTFYMYWEITRCLLASIQFILVILYLNVLVKYRFQMHIVFLAFDATVYADMYVRSNLRFYNENNILVTHPIHTLGNYFHNGLLLDVWSAFPFYELQLNYLFRSDTAKVKAYVVMCLITRPFQLHRVLSGIDLLSNHIKMFSANKVIIGKNLFLITAILLILSTFATIMCYDVNNESIITFKENSWLVYANTGRNYLTYNTILLFGFSFILSLYTYSSYGVFSAQNNYEVSILICIIVVLVLMRWYTFAKFTSAGLHSALASSKGQNDMKKFIRYCKKEFVTESIQKRITETYEHINQYKDTLALDLASELFPPVLLNDFSFNVYKDAFENTKILHGQSEGFYRYLSNQVVRKLYKKDEVVIRCNDIQDNMYIIKKGKIDITIANTLLTSLSIGGMFGCFNKYSKIRQTITATAVIHTEMMQINSRVFHRVIATKPEIVKYLNYNVSICSEYIEEVKKHKDSKQQEGITIETSSHDHRDADTLSTVSRFSRINRTGRSISPHQLKTKRCMCRVKLRENSKFYKWYNYFINVHVGPLSTLHVYIMIKLLSHSKDYLVNNILLYSFDVLFFTKILVGFLQPYIDEESGLLVTNFRSIARRYAKSHFFLDAITVLPFELVAKYVLKFELYFESLFLCNRLLRIFFLVKYYDERLRKRSMRHHLRWTYLIYLALYYIQLFTNIWTLVACYKTMCKHLDNLSHAEVVYKEAAGLLESILDSYLFVLNLITSTGIRSIQPHTTLQLTLTALISYFTIYMTTFITCGCTIIQIIDNYSLSIYEYNTLQVRTYLQNQSLSPVLLIKVWKYYLHLWKEQCGEHFPVLIRNANDILKQDILYDVYGHHLKKHYLFANAHVDFLRQLMLYVKRCTYPQDYTIVGKGDVDGSMYFIHSGTVLVIETLRGFEQVIHELTTGNSFGEGQGFLYNPHPFAYKAKTAVDILILDIRDWNFLLKYFPATEEEIRTQALSQGLYFD